MSIPNGQKVRGNLRGYPFKDLGLKHGFYCAQGRHEGCPGDGYYSDSPRVGENIVYTLCVCECHKISDGEA